MPAPISYRSRLSSRQSHGWRASAEVRDTAIISLIVGLGTAALISEALYQDVQSDFTQHMQMTIQSIQSGVFPGDAGFYFMNALFAGFSTNLSAIRVSLVVLLALATAGKTWASIGVVRQEGAWFSPRLRRLPLWALLAIGLCNFAFSFPGHRSYIGQIPANVFHNSTEIFLMPFAVALFGLTLSHLHRPNQRLLTWGVPLVILSVLVKPSLMFCVIPVFPVAAVVRYGWRSSEVRRAVLLAGVGLFAVFLEYLYIYVVRPGGVTSSNDGGVALGFLTVWNNYTPSIPDSLLLSYVLPIVAFTVGGKRLLRSRAVLYATGLAIVGLIEFAVLKETGSREFDGNFLWQAIVCTYLLFLAILGTTINWVLERGWTWRSAIIMLAFCAHVAAGAIYLHTSFQTRAFF